MLIKSAKSDRLMKEAVVLDMGDLARQAERILTNARAEAFQMLQRAREESDRLVANADARGYQQGFDRGFDEGKVAGQQQGRTDAFQQQSQTLADLRANWSSALEHWEQLRRGMIQDAREDVVRFAFALAKKVVRRLPPTDPTIVRDQVAAALEAASRAHALEVVVHPSERALLEQNLPELLERAGRSQHATICVDNSCAPGGCIVRTGQGRIDATIDAQLDRIAEALVPVPNHQQPATPESIH